MAGLDGAKTTIGPDGLTVITTTDSVAAAQEIAASQEYARRKLEGGPGAKINGWLRRSLDRFDETLGIYGDRALAIIRDVLMVCAMALAIYAWYRVLPGYEVLMCVIGAAIVFGIKTAASRLDNAILAKSAMQFWFGGIIIVGLFIEVIASTSLQASVAVDQATGRADIDAKIQNLRNEQNALQIALVQNPGVSPEAQDKLIEGFRLTPAVNSKGTQLSKRVGELVGDCKGSSYYVTIYCPTLLEMEATRDKAVAYATNKTRFEAIPAELSALEANRPKVSSTFALGQKLEENDSVWWGGMVIPVGLTILLNLTMLTFAYLAGRAERTPPVEEPPAEEVPV